jgi:hypothetical protein
MIVSATIPTDIAIDVSQEFPILHFGFAAKRNEGDKFCRSNIVLALETSQLEDLRDKCTAALEKMASQPSQGPTQIIHTGKG